MPEVVYTGWEGESGEDALLDDNPHADATDATVASGITRIELTAFYQCWGLDNVSFLEGSAVTAVGDWAFTDSGVESLRGMEGVTDMGFGAFASCVNLRTIEGLGCEVMDAFCFARCTLLQSLKGWPASMTVIPRKCFWGCTGMTAVDCDLSHVTSIEVNAFVGCTSLLPPELSAPSADPAAVLAYLKRKSFLERAPLRYAVYASVLVARKQEGRRVAERRRASPLAAAMARLPPDMNRVIVEFLHGVAQAPQ
jgi:hypothetical protein